MSHSISCHYFSLEIKSICFSLDVIKIGPYPLKHFRLLNRSFSLQSMGVTIFLQDKTKNKKVPLWKGNLSSGIS